MSCKNSIKPTFSTATETDQFGAVVQKARQVLARSQSGLASKSATNTAGNTNIAHLEKTIGDLADLVENTFDPVWKENYRVALTRTLAATEKAKSGQRDTVMSSQAIRAAGQAPDTFGHPAVGFVNGLDVSSFSARQAGYQQRFNAPPPAMPGPSLPLDPSVGGNRSRQRDVPGLGTTAIPTQTNPNGSWFVPRGKKAFGTSHR